MIKEVNKAAASKVHNEDILFGDKETVCRYAPKGRHHGSHHDALYKKIHRPCWTVALPTKLQDDAAMDNFEAVHLSSPVCRHVVTPPRSRVWGRRSETLI